VVSTTGAEHHLLRLPAVGDNAAMEAEPLKTEPPKRKRRWYQFSLRTLMIVVTLLAVPCAYVAHEARIVAERRAWTVAHIGSIVADFDGRKLKAFYDPKFDPPLMRRWLGDRPIEYLTVWSEADATDALRLFPEAAIAEKP
jgi:hypothetical protein